MSISVKSDASGNAGALQINGIDKLIINADGTVSTTVAPAAGDSSFKLATTSLLQNAISNISNKNRIHNGDARVAQRVPFVAVSGVGGFGGPDRYLANNASAGGQFTQDVGSLTDGGIIKNTIRQTVNIAATDFTTARYWGGVHQSIEGYNCYDLAAKAFTVSFLFRASVAGTYSVAVRDNSGTNSYVTTFTAVANTVQRVVVNVPVAPAPLNLPNSNAIGLIVGIGTLGVGTFATSTLNAWQSGNYNTFVGSTQWALTVNATIQVTDLQLEEGTFATPFERRHYSDELALCQRYYETGFVNVSGYMQSSVNDVTSVLGLSVPKRVTPAITTSGGSASTISTNTITAQSLSSITVRLATNGSGSGNAFFSCNFAASAEL